MNQIEEYIKARDEQAKENMKDRLLRNPVSMMTSAMVVTNYVKNFTWMGIPILQYPTDLMVMQELIFRIDPDVIIETGVAFGGMTRFYADMTYGAKDVIAIDIDIRPHACNAIRFAGAIPIQGSSTDPKTLEQVSTILTRYSTKPKVLVSLDSNHTHAHVLRELELYAPLVSVGSYIVVFDTAIEFYGHLDKHQDRPWGKGNNPYTAVQEFLGRRATGMKFEVDREIEARALITSAPSGWLRRMR